MEYKLTKGKTLSKIGKVLALTFVIITFFLLPDRDVNSIIKIGGFILVVFAPIDLSIWLEIIKRR